MAGRASPDGIAGQMSQRIANMLKTPPRCPSPGHGQDTVTEEVLPGASPGNEEPRSMGARGSNRVMLEYASGCGGAKAAGSGFGAADSESVREIKRYVDQSLMAMEARLLAAMRSAPSPQPGAQRYSSADVHSRDSGAGASRPPTPPFADGSPEARLSLTNVPPGEVQIESERTHKAALKHRQEVKNREQFMAKFSGKEIFGDQGDVRKSMGGPFSRNSLQDRNICANLKKNGVVIDPAGRFRVSWDMVSITLVCYIALALPFRIAFDSTSSFGLNLLDLLIDIFFIIDIALNFVTAFTDDGQLITGHKLIAVHYLRTWFVFDLIASFPVDWCLYFPPALWPDDERITKDTLYAQLFASLRLIKLLRLLRIARLFRYLERFEEFFSLGGALSSNFLRLAKLGIIIIVFCHWNGCFQFLLATLDEPTRSETTLSLAQLTTNVTDGSLYAYSAYIGRETPLWIAPNGDKFYNGFHELSWVYRLGLSDQRSFTQWEWSFFTAFSQMLAIAHGVVEPMRSIEVWGYLLSNLLGAVLYGVFVAILTAVISDLDMSAKAYRSKLDMVNQYMHHSALPRDLRAKLRTYYELSFPSKRLFDEDHILASISRPLRQEVCLHKCRSVLKALHVLEGAETGLPGAISQELQRVVFVAGDYIIREGEETEGMFFVEHGLVELLTHSSATDEERLLTTLGESSMFGEMALLSQQGRAVASVRVKTYCEGYHLSKRSFNKLTNTYPTFKEYLESVARLRLAKNAKARGENTDDLQGMLKSAQGGQGNAMQPAQAKNRSKVARRASKLTRNLKAIRQSTYGQRSTTFEDEDEDDFRSRAKRMLGIRTTGRGRSAGTIAERVSERAEEEEDSFGGNPCAA